MLEMDVWMHEFVNKVQQAFGDRLLFAGLQGSRARKEATQSSDIDVVVILDALDAEDVRRYKAAIDGLEYRDKMCGFIAGQQELWNWEKSDLFQFCHDTIAYYGKLETLTPEIGQADVLRAVQIGACNIYHGVIHNLLHTREPAVLAGLYKAAGFVLRAQHFAQTGQYIANTGQLMEALPEREKRLLENRIQAAECTAETEAFQRLSDYIMDWASGIIRGFEKPDSL